MEGDSKRQMQLKCAFTLKKFLEENKSQSIQNEKVGKKDLILVDNLSKLASTTGLRPATISSIFNADSSPSITNVIKILVKLERSLSQFGEQYDQIAETDLRLFESELKIKKEIEKKRKSGSEGN